MNTLAKTKGAATHARTRRSGSVSDWRTSFPRTIFVVQRKSFILKLKFSTKYLFGCKNYCEFRRFFSPPKKPKNAGCFGKNAGMRETTKFAGFPAIAGWLTPMLWLRNYMAAAIYRDRNRHKAAGTRVLLL